MSFRPYLDYKESGSPWLGQIPSHWHVKRLRFVARLNPSKRSTQALSSTTEVSFLPMSSVAEDGTFDRESSRTLAEVEEGYTYFADNDIIIAKVTPCFENGKGAILKELIGGRGFGTTELTVIRTNAPTAANFVYWVLSSPIFRGPAQPEMVGAGGLKRVPDDFFKNFPVPVPPIEEMLAISSFLNSEVGRIDNLISSVTGDITLRGRRGSLLSTLRERRSSVIGAAVTGKIDVRGWTAQEVRDAVSAEIIHFNAQGRTLHRVKFQKLLYLAQTFAGIEEIDGRFERYAAGPHDGTLMRSVEDALTTGGVVSVSQANGAGSEVTYRAKTGTRPDRSRLAAMLGERLPKLEHVLGKLAAEDMHGAEAVATLYAVWNDALLDGETPDEARLVRGFLDEWHPKKRENFTREEVVRWIDNLRRNGLVPEGRGRKTQAGALL